MNDFYLAQENIPPGKSRNIRLKISENYSGHPVTLDVQVQNAPEPGPVLLVTAVIHGDELNGMGIIHDLMTSQRLDLKRGTLILIPVLNILGLENHTRYLPDRRDLNRCFPGEEKGTLGSRQAFLIKQELVSRADYLIDLHTATAHRTNYPSIRGDLSNPGVKKIAEAFGCEIILDKRAPLGALRREACRSGCPAIAFEAGEVWKIEPGVLDIGLRGIRSVAAHLGMIEEEPIKPLYQTTVSKHKWLRSNSGGIMKFHVSPGSLVGKGDMIAEVTDLFGEYSSVLKAPRGGIVIGLTTLPIIKPGYPVCNLAYPDLKISEIRKRLEQGDAASMPIRLREELATNVVNQSDSESELEGD